MTIVIRNLPASISEEELKHLFAEYGEVQVTLLAQVEFDSGDSQTELRAIADLNHTELRGQAIQLDLADAPSGEIAFPSPDPP